MANIAIVGSRDYEDAEFIAKALDELIASRKISQPVIVSGGASGVDSIAEKLAAERGYEAIVYPADWKAYGRAAGPKRNKQIVEHSHIVLAFRKNNSKGTTSTIKLAQKAGIPVVVHEV